MECIQFMAVSFSSAIVFPFLAVFGALCSILGTRGEQFQMISLFIVRIYIGYDVKIEK